jgi:parallel beta-helix repeat protein
MAPVEDAPTPYVAVSFSDVQGGRDDVYEFGAGLQWGPGNVDSDPCFLDVSSGDYHLRCDSACIDAGDPNYVGEPNETDMDGNPRVVNGRVDMGAHEFQGVIYVDDDAPGDPGPGDPNVSDPNENGTKAHPFDEIQEAIDAAQEGHTVLVYPGIYNEATDFSGKAITVQGVATEAGVPIVETPIDYAFSFYNDEETNSVLRNFVIRDSCSAAFLIDASPILSNLTIVENRFGIEAYAGSQPDISNCIFYDNTNGDLFGCQAQYSWVEQDFNEPAEPMFADANGGDYHLLSERGRYWPEHDVWVLDEETSPCVDGGDPNDNPADERMPNGGRINIGAYGGTAYASMSEWALKSDTDRDGRVSMKDFAILAGEWLEELGWLE